MPIWQVLVRAAAGYFGSAGALGQTSLASWSEMDPSLMGLASVSDVAERVCHLLGVSVRILRECKQGWREPSGAARSLIRIAQERPEVLWEIFFDEVA